MAASGRWCPTGLPPTGSCCAPSSKSPPWPTPRKRTSRFARASTTDLTGDVMTQTTQTSHTPSILGAEYEAIAAKYRPIFDRIRASALQREQQRELGAEPIRWLKEARFGALRVPVAFGGDGATLPQLFQILVELSEADSNITQALRGHFAFVEDRLNAPRDAANEVWLRRFAAGDLAGNAWTEVGDVAIGDVITRVSQKDDWDGFGQRTTGSGTSIYENAEVDEENIFPFASRFKYQTAFYQLFHLSTLAGIAHAITRDAAQQVRDRRRIFSTGNAPSVAQDVQVQQVVGEVAAAAYAAEATAVRAAFAAQRAYDTHWAGNAEAERQANIEAELESAQGQVVISDLVLRAATQFFNALGASAASSSKSLDRHWRNARTVASHNPVIYKARIIGDWRINGTEPPYVWQIGAGPAKATPSEPAKAA